MKLLRYILFAFWVLFSCTACAGETVSVKLKVIDQDSAPVSDSEVQMSFLLSEGANAFKGITDKNGDIKASDRAMFGVAISVRKQGYYESLRRTGYGDQELIMELREVKSPISMYVNKLENLKKVVSESNQSIGYDLKMGDFLAPHGKGNIADLIFNGHFNYEKAFYHDSKLTIEFSNELDGLTPFKIEERNHRWQRTPESDLVSEYTAPESGYINRWEFESRRNGVDKPAMSNYIKENNYYFRVRTKVDDDGNIESAYYGKIYGEFPNIIHYFNPNENDRNIEFDIKKNLSNKKLHALEP